jgi:hypothetical protein
VRDIFTLACHPFLVFPSLSCASPRSTVLVSSVGPWLVHTLCPLYHAIGPYPGTCSDPGTLCPGSWLNTILPVAEVFPSPQGGPMVIEISRLWHISCSWFTVNRTEVVPPSLVLSIFVSVRESYDHLSNSKESN